jgi:hypothetical protein
MGVVVGVDSHKESVAAATVDELGRKRAKMAQVERKSASKQDLQQVNVRVPRDVYEALRTYTYATDVSMNEVVVRAIVDFLATQGRWEEVEAFLQRARKQYRGALDRSADL